MEALERRSTLALKLEMAALAGTSSSSGTAVTGSGTAFTTALVVGNIIGNADHGYRRVISITDATHLTVDSAFDPDLSGDTISKDSYGVDPTITSADVIRFVSPFGLEPERGEINPNEIIDTFDEAEPLFGEETVAGDLAIELHGSGTPGIVPEADALYHCAIGERRISTASLTVTGSSTTTVKLDTGDGLNHRVGEAIMVDTSVAGDGSYEVTFITAINSNNLTVSPALTLAPPSGRTIGAGVHYKLSKNELKSLWIQFWRGDITLEKFKGCKVSNMTLDFTTGKVVDPKFSIQGKETDEPTNANYALGDPSLDAGKSHVARHLVVKVKGTLYPVSNTSFSIANELARVLAATSAGTIRISRVRRTITGSFSLLYENKDIEATFRDGTTSELMIVSSTGEAKLISGNTLAVKFPKIKYTKATKTIDNGMFKYDIPFKAIKTAGEDSLSTLSFL